MVFDTLLPSNKKQRTAYQQAARSAFNTAANAAYYYYAMPRRRISTRSRTRNRAARTIQRFVRRKKRSYAGTGVTFQHDAKNIYKRKSMPKYKRLRWKRFVHKVDAAGEKDLGSRQIIFNKKKEFSNQTSGEQGKVNICLYGWDSNTTDETWHNDLRYISQLENEGATTSADGVYVGNDTNYLFQSGVLDITMTNTCSYTDTSTLPVPVLEVDLYQWSMGKDSEMNGTNYQTGSAIFNNSNFQTLAIKDNNTGPSTTPISIAKRGSTPFDMSRTLSTMNVKIWKKTKYFISPNQTVTFQIRDPRKHILNKKYLKTNTSGLLGFNYPKVTKHCLIVFKSVPGPHTVGSTAGLLTEQLTIGVTRKYFYKMRGIKEDRSLYINN